MSAFTVFSSDCIPVNNLIDGLGWGWGGGQWDWTQPKVFTGWADPLRSPLGRPRRWVGGAGWGKCQTEGRENLMYK